MNAKVSKINRDDVIKMQGELVKRAMKSGRNWKKRYFVLKNNALIYYDEKPTEANDKSSHPKGLVEITAKTVVRASPVKKHFAFEIVARPQVLYVHAESQKEAKRWMDEINTVIQELKRDGKGQKLESRRGWLVKRAIKSGRNWKKRFFILRNGRLSYYDQPPSGATDRPKGLIELTPDAKVSAAVSTLGFGKKHAFYVEVDGKTLHLSAVSKDERDAWINAIFLVVLRKNNIKNPDAIRVGMWLREQTLQQYVRAVVQGANLDTFEKLRAINEDEVKDLFKTGKFSMNDARKLQVGLTTLKNMSKGDIQSLCTGTLSTPFQQKDTTNLGPPPVFEEEEDKDAGERKSLSKRISFKRKAKPDPTFERRIYTWGDSRQQQLGLGAATGGMAPEPTHLEALKLKTEAKIAAAGPTCTAVVTKKDGALFTWGTGPLGLGKTKQESNRPYLVSALKGIQISKVSIGDQHMGCITGTGEVYVWGHGPNGELGLGKSLLEAHEPTRLDVPTMSQLSVGPHHTLLLTSEGKVFAMGSGKNGKLGLGDTTDCFSPKEIPTLSNRKVSKVAAGGEFSLALSNHGRNCFSWGTIAGDEISRVPICMRKFDERRIDDIVASESMAAFIVGIELDDYNDDIVTSSVYTMGLNGLLLGHGDNLPKLKPTLVESLEGHGVIQLSCSKTHAAATCHDGRLLMWGEDDRGQLGSGYLVNVARPHLAISIAGYRYLSVSCGDGFTTAVLEYDPACDVENEQTAGMAMAPPPPPEETMGASQAEKQKFSDMMQNLSKLTAMIETSSDNFPPGTSQYAENWLEHTHPSTNKKYYENQTTGEVQWTPPTP
mmetsp:Transcript_29279/g.47030  ORF Transcript_29279/g.47030 Transcript_29279/m.47030 type:complete len:830 (-) Transcript_29279:37-2526(-)